jgi:hypothetical protein
LQAAILFDLERDHLEVRKPVKPFTPDLGLPVSQSVIAKQGPAGLVGQERRDGPIVPQEHHLTRQRFRVHAQTGLDRLQRGGQRDHSSSEHRVPTRIRGTDFADNPCEKEAPGQPSACDHDHETSSRVLKGNELGDSPFG